MANGILSSAVDALTTRRGATIAGVAILAAAALFGIPGRDRGPAGVRPAVAAEAAKPAVDPTGAFTPAQVAALQSIIKDYLIANPEVMIEVTREIEKRQKAQEAAEQLKVLSENKNRVFQRAGDFVYGNPKGDITVVEFFDYNCGWCKRAVDDILKLTKADPRVRVVMKEYPIFGGPPSVLAAKAAMASVKQGKYWEFHMALMREKQVTEQNLFTVAQRVGLDVARLKADMADKRYETIIEQNVNIGQELGIEGTPGFLVDSRINVGYVPADGMQRMIAEIRKAGCKVC